MGGFQNFAISFTIISILAGCLTSYYIAFQWGGPVAVTWGWLLVGGFCIIVSLAMAEIASTYPTAGGLYYWASKLGEPGLGLVHRLVQPRRPDRGHRGDRLRPGDVRDVAAGPALRLPEHVEVDLRHLHSGDGDRDSGQHVRGFDHRASEHDLGLVAHGRCRVHRARADHRPGQPPVGRLRLRRDDQQLRVQRRRTSATSCSGTSSGSGC